MYMYMQMMNEIVLMDSGLVRYVLHVYYCIMFVCCVSIVKSKKQKIIMNELFFFCKKQSI